MSRYAWVLLLSMAAPLALSFFPGLKFYRSLRSLILSLALVLAIFGSWDIFAVYRGHWFFDADAVWRIRIINLPVEEVLFFPVITFCCIFTWESLMYLKRKVK